MSRKLEVHDDGTCSYLVTMPENNGRFVRKRIVKKFFNARMSRSGIVHRFMEGKEIPWCGAKNVRSIESRKNFFPVEKTDEPVTCKVCLRGGFSFF